MGLHFLEFYMIQIIKYLLFSPLRFPHAAYFFGINQWRLYKPFTFYTAEKLCCSMGKPLFVHSSVCGYLGCFQFLAIANKTATDIWIPNKQKQMEGGQRYVRTTNHLVAEANVNTLAKNKNKKKFEVFYAIKFKTFKTFTLYLWLQILLVIFTATPYQHGPKNPLLSW